MNIFDAGGLTALIALIFTLILGTGFFILINNIFEIWYLGFGAMVGEWLLCCAVGAFIVNWINWRNIYSIMDFDKTSYSYSSFISNRFFYLF